MVIVACDRCGEQIHKTDKIYNIHMVTRHMGADDAITYDSILYGYEKGRLENFDNTETDVGLLCVECFKAVKQEVFKKSKL